MLHSPIHITSHICSTYKKVPEEIEEKPCAKDMFRCENGPCIHESLHCDGVIDCPFDISDELDCHTLYYNFCKWLVCGVNFHIVMI